MQILNLIGSFFLSQAEKEEDENDVLSRQTDVTVVKEAEEQEEEYQSEGEEEALELEKEPEAEEEGREKTEEAEEEVERKQGKERVEEAEEAIEDEEDDVKEMTERFPDAAGDKAQIAVPLREAGEGVAVVGGHAAVCTAKLTDVDEENEIPTDVSDEGVTIVHECQANDTQKSEDEREDGEQGEEGVVEIENTKETCEPEEDVESQQQVADQTEHDVGEMAHLDPKEVEEDPTEQVIFSEPSAVSIPESHCETELQESGSITPSKTSTIHINLVSPSAEKVASFFQRSPTAAPPKESESPPHTVAEPAPAPESAEDDGEGGGVDIEEEVKQQLHLDEEATLTDSVELPSNSSEQSKVRFTITPAWQRSQSWTSPSSPPACGSSSPSTTAAPAGEEAESASEKDSAAEVGPASLAKVELVLSPGRVRSAGSITAKPQNNAPSSPCFGKPQAVTSTKGDDMKRNCLYSFYVLELWVKYIEGGECHKTINILSI